MFGQYFGSGYFGDGFYGPSAGEGAPEPAVDTGGAGNLDWLRKKRRRGKVVKWSELESHERAAALAAALAEKSIPIDASAEEIEEFDDDEILVRALAVTFHTLQWGRKYMRIKCFCPLCDLEFSTEIDDAPSCREHGRFGWFRRLWWFTGIPSLLRLI